MKILPFAIERYFAKHEFSAPYLLSCSDAEPLLLSELLTLADEETRSLWEALSLGYTESQGHPALLQAIAGLYSGVSSDQILEVIPEEGIFIAMNTLLEAGDHVIVTYPGYQSLYQIAQSIGCEVSWWQPNMQIDMCFSVERLAELITDRTRLIIANFPHNPTGALISKNEQAEMVKLAQARNLPIFSDEMYRYSELNPSDRLPSMVEIYEKGITLGGLSKSFSLPGLRVGWLVSQDQDFMDRVSMFKDYTSICGSATSEILALIALRSTEKILARNADILKSNFIEMEGFFKKHGERFRWIPPRAGTVTFPEYLGRENADTLCQHLLESAGIMLLPSSIMGFEGNYVRIGYGRKDFPDVLHRLDHFLRSN